MKLNIIKVEYHFENYKVVLDKKGNAWVNGVYVCQFKSVQLSQTKALSAIKHFKENNKID